MNSLRNRPPLLVPVLLGLLCGALHADLRINEFMASNSRYAPDPQGQYEDWVEIANDSDRTVETAGLYLTDDFGMPTKWRIPEGDPATTLAPGGFLLVWMDGDVEDPGRHANFKLSGEGEELALVAADGVTILDSVVFGPQVTDISYGRDMLDPNLWRHLAWPTPGKANMPGYRGTVDAPVVSHPRGFYDDPFSVTLSHPDPEATIVYTLDGRDPVTRGGTTYTGPIPIRQTTVLRVAAVKPAYVPSPVLSHTYIYRASAALKSLPIISLVGSPEETFYEPDGVMAIVGGSYSGGVWQSGGEDSHNNVLVHGLERPVSMELLKANDGTTLQLDCGIRVHGSNWLRPRYTRSDASPWSGNNKFSLRLYFRGEYGASWLNYPLFPFAVDRFKSIVLRAGHNDRTNPFIKDELQRRLMKDAGHVSSGGTFANLLINGEYKGYYNPCEHITETFCQSWFDSTQDFDIIAMGNQTREGDREHITALTNYVRTHDLSVPEFYENVVSQVDVDEFIDYLVVRLWAGDWDWPHNNWSAARERAPEGRWTFFIWDGEGGMFSNRMNTVFFDRLHSNSNENAILYNGLHDSPMFRLRFGDRVEKHFGPGGILSPEHIALRFREMQEELRGVIPNMNTYVLDTWVPQRKGIFFDACQREGVYTFPGPQAFINLSPQTGGYIQPGDHLTLLAEGGEGTVYFTTDGSDPAANTDVSPQQWVTLLSRAAAKRVHVPSSSIGRTWTAPGYNDTAWMASSGLPGGVGYERNSGYQDQISLDVGEAMASSTTCYVRIPFPYQPLGGTRPPDTLSLRIQYDDGYVAYLNGTEIARGNAPGALAWNSTATNNHDDQAALTFEAVDCSASLPLLQDGDNVLAIQGLNTSTNSSDFLINAELVLGSSVPPTLPEELRAFETPLPLTGSVRIKARTFRNNAWSTLTEATYALHGVREGLRVTELMYHPLDGGDPNDPNLEYVELQNVSDQPLNLALVRFTDGIDFTFPDVNLAPGEMALVVRHEPAFIERYGPDRPVLGQYDGSLNNAGEWVELRDAAGEIVQRFRYRDDWLPQTDGEGYALTVIDPLLGGDEALSDPNQWQAGTLIGGSPGWRE